MEEKKNWEVLYIPPNITSHSKDNITWLITWPERKYYCYHNNVNTITQLIYQWGVWTYTGTQRNFNQFLSRKRRWGQSQAIEFENEKITTSLSAFYHLSRGKFKPCRAGWIPWLTIFFCNLLFKVSFSINHSFQSTCQSGQMKGFTRRFQTFDLWCRQSQNLHAFGTKKLCLGNVFRRAGKSAAVKLTILLVDYTYDKTVILVQTKSYQGS